MTNSRQRQDPTPADTKTRAVSRTGLVDVVQSLLTVLLVGQFVRASVDLALTDGTYANLNVILHLTRS